jgi:DNA-binding GntR family transcriptional regulator
MWALPGRMNLSLKQHEAVMSAIRKGDAREAAERMRDHVTSGRETLLAHLRQELASDRA